jgi:hypothetical protein
MIIIFPLYIELIMVLIIDYRLSSESGVKLMPEIASATQE